MPVIAQQHTFKSTGIPGTHIANCLCPRLAILYYIQPRSWSSPARTLFKNNKRSPISIHTLYYPLRVPHPGMDQSLNNELLSDDTIPPTVGHNDRIRPIVEGLLSWLLNY